MKHARGALAVAALLVGSFTSAELSQSYKDWPLTPAGFLLTKEERKAYEKIATDAEAQAFIELFWAKRDPDLNTPVNEYRLEFDRRVAAADKQFSTEKVKGSVSDRGRVLLLLGRPTRRLMPSAGSSADSTRPDESLGGYGAAEVWKYAKQVLPKEVKPDEVEFVFAETRPRAGDFPLDRGDRRNSIGAKLLLEVPELLVHNPKLTEPPKLGMLPGSRAASAGELAVFSVAERPWPQGAEVVSTAGMLSSTLHPLWIYVFLPDGTPLATKSVGRVVNADTGAEAGSFSVAIRAVPVTGGQGYEFSLPVDAGNWKADIALLNDIGTVAVTAVTATTEALPAEGTYISPFYWGSDARQEAQAHLGDAFNIGGWHIIPARANTYKPADALAYFAFVVRPHVEQPAENPAADAAAATGAPAVAPPEPKFEYALKLYAGDKKVSELPGQAAQVSHITEDLWMFGNSLPINVFRKGGDYALEVTLRDLGSKVERTVKIPLKVEAAEAAAPAAK